MSIAKVRLNFKNNIRNVDHFLKYVRYARIRNRLVYNVVIEYKDLHHCNTIQKLYLKFACMYAHTDAAINLYISMLWDWQGRFTSLPSSCDNGTFYALDIFVEKASEG